MAESVTSSSRLSQFGLYRSIDARTEEFLKLSRKRQIRQGCACAVAATVVTVAVVIVILLVYEYVIVETSLVQRNEESNVTNDTPVADRLDRSYFGFDQDYFEQMPLLVNAMQENGLIDILEQPTTTQKLDKRGKYLRRPPPNLQMNSIRRTSPRPFIFEYRSPTPSPFHKKYNSRSWIEGYRNAQRMKNLETVINYLEKTINAKFGDLYSYPPSTHIAFSGVYVHPGSGESNIQSSTTGADMLPQSSNTNQVRTDRKRNHQSDPLFSFKPDSPGDVNLLADGPLKFSPVPTPSIIPMFRPGPHTKGCVGIRCGVNNLVNKLNLVQGSAEIKSSDPTLFDKPSTFSVIMNLLPMSTPSPTPPVLTTLSPYDMSRIYFTTSRPEFQFRRKSSAGTVRRRPFKLRRKRPRVMEKKIGNGVVYDNPRSSERKDMAGPAPSAANMILTVKVFPKAEVPQTTTDNPPAFTPSLGILNSTQVEDYHVGSSGIIPVHLPPPSTSTSLPHETMTQQFFESMKTSSEEPRSWSTNPPDIIKFSQEDARVPDQYQRLRELQDYSRQFFEETNRRNSRDSYEVKEPPRTLIVKLKNEDEESTTTEYYTEQNTEEEENRGMDSTTAKTYVPQINGHYRNINVKSREINNWMQENSEKRKSRLEVLSVTGHRTYVPTYVEIKRIRDKSENKQ